jgi:cytoskeletal protein RodZ
MIEDLCRQLKEKRKEMAYSLEYVVNKTKLHPTVIRDIEAGNLSNINAAYLRGFVKIYAAFLSVDIANTFEEINNFKKEQPKLKTVKIKQKEAAKTISEDTKTHNKEQYLALKKNLLATLVGVILLALVLVVGISIVRAVAGMFSRTTVEREEKDDEAVTFEKANDLTVSLTAKKKCFIRVVVDGKLLFEGVIDKGAIESWKAQNELEFKISDGSAIYLEVNGKPVPKLTSIRKPIKSLKITPSGISVDK